MENEDIYILIAKHFSGESTPDEKEAINAWLLKDPLNRDSFEEMKSLWDGTTSNESRWDVDAAWKNLSTRTNVESKRAYRPFLTTRNRYLNIAVVFLVILCGYFIFNQSGIMNTKENIDWIEKVTVSGEKAEIILPDNSKIILNGSSRIKYPSRLNNVKREVELEGEAYFEIAHNPNRPFIVYAGDISTTVLGTKFNVSAFKNEKNITISLIEGKVKVSKKESKEEQPIVILKPDQQIIYSKEENVSSVGLFDKEITIGWKDNILKFDNEPLERILTRMERAYGTKFELNTDSFKDFKVTANFKNESSQTVIEVLQRLTGLEVNTIKENNEIKKIEFREK